MRVLANDLRALAEELRRRTADKDQQVLHLAGEVHQAALVVEEALAGGMGLAALTVDIAL